jgi:putative effector of murein hydrolase LrgA (UPF0299 family)
MRPSSLNNNLLLISKMRVNYIQTRLIRKSLSRLINKLEILLMPETTTILIRGPKIYPSLTLQEWP